MANLQYTAPCNDWVISVLIAQARVQYNDPERTSARSQDHVENKLRKRAETRGHRGALSVCLQARADHFQCKNAMAFWDVVGVLGALWLALVLGLAVYGFNIANRWRHRQFPGPRPAWLVGNMARTDDPDCIGPQGKSFLALQRWAKTYGPCFVFYLGRQPTVVLSGEQLEKAGMCTSSRQGVK
jgi:hypothetical protein